MKTLPYTPLPITHHAFSYVSHDDTVANKTYLADRFKEWVEQHSHIEVCAVDPNRIGDDYDEMERTAWIDSPGGFPT